MNALNEKVLVLNRNWQAIAVTTVQTALCDMCRGVATGMDIGPENSLRPVKWEDWLSLDIRAEDKFIMASKDRRIRLPSVIVKASYDKVPKRRPKCDRRGVKERDKAICQVTGEHAPDGTLDHLHPRSRGGKNTWTNLAWMKKDINHAKGDKTLAEAGLKLIRPPVEPKEVPVSVTIKAHRPEWAMFLPTIFVEP